ncbi:hypothetical protein D9613_010811 [Agrocybe pediades]|uniref:F-box domain-containing protein n=1 Tax=Agrocybe pediades TaxID=84607 RepID=A0A8H4VMA0_9AGAR|nr:hypothetical protein D9613_010811 [Agrocybe pediades]
MADLKHTFISTLHRELLWMIFLQNVLTPDVYRFTDWTCSPLTTVRYCSQVCRDWRYILLQSSSIWSRVIDLEQLNQRGQDWKKEVLSRTGQAPLWVYGQPNISTMLFFVPFLEENWGRVQRMQIFGLSEMPTDTFTNSLNRLAKISWNFLQKPAPSLRVIDVYLSTAVHLPNSLFGSYAPLLKRFAIQANNYKLNTKDSWLKNLSHVIICGNLAFEDIGGALEQMPNLVTLEICCNNVDLDVAGPAINLPRMKKLCLRLGSNMLNGVALLERIEPASDCCIYIQGGRGEWKPAPEEEEYERYEDAISKHVLPCLKIHPPTVLSYIFTYDTLFIQEPSGALHDPKHFYSELHIPFYFEFFWFFSPHAGSHRLCLVLQCYRAAAW